MDNELLTTERIWDAFHARLRQFILKHVRDERAVSDILQDVFLKIHAHIGTLRMQDRLTSWLFQVAGRTIADYYRDERGPQLAPLPHDLADRLIAPEESSEDEAIQSLLPCIRPMVESLPARYRDALLLTEYEGLSQKELAARLGISFSGAKSRVQRARDKLKTALLRCCHFEFDRLGQVIDYHPNCGCCRTSRSGDHAESACAPASGASCPPAPTSTSTSSSASSC